MTLLSRVFGFIRDMVIAMMFGSSAIADAFFVAFRIPNLQRRILGEGAVSAAFVPVFCEYLNTKSKEETWNLASNLFNVLLIALLASTAIIMVFAPAVVSVFAPGFIDEPDKFNLTVKLTRWMAPYLICIGLAALCMGILNAFKEFAIPAASPTLLNISMILSSLLIGARMDEPIMGLAIGVLLGGLLQFLVQVPSIVRNGFKFKLTADWKHPGIIKIGKLLGPSVVGLGAYEINIIVDTLLASLLPGGSISYLYYANRLVQLPMGIFAVALGVAILPTLSDHASRKEFPELIKTLSFGIRLILFITVPATVGLILLRFPIINSLWERGEFSRTATEGTAFALLCYSVGLCGFAGTRVVATAFYSLQDTKTPAKIGIYSIAVNIIFSVLLMVPLQHGGLALATSIAATFNALALIVILKKRMGQIGGRKILNSFLKLLVASTCLGIITYFINQEFFDPLAPIKIRLMVLAISIVAGLLSFYLVSLLMKKEELAVLIDLLRRKRTLATSKKNSL
ncbi:MAG: murein biosynthesis integral membrane protein MurJ [Nitrospinae bacterium RIFCSPLOWO2_12_FULL_47_7]|nr:MAG: murein biosynthesis integral membrane protein MurJ [Nitrospinae bacterium RIFCSPLOWO2_12_FULL_47_7]